MFSSIQSLSHVQLFVTPWTTADEKELINNMKMFENTQGKCKYIVKLGILLWYNMVVSKPLNSNIKVKRQNY